MDANAPFVTTLDQTKAAALKAQLEERGFSFSKPAYTIFQAKKPGLSCTLYESGKLVVQGKDKQEFVEFFLEPEVVGFSEVDMTAHIGGDEAGKGDFFGPLCVAGVFGDEAAIGEFVRMRIADSKTIKDAKILLLADELAKFPHHVIALGPRKYNELYEKFGNLNHLLAWAHAEVIGTLQEKTGAKRALIDQFAYPHVLEKAVGKRQVPIQLTQRTKAESDPVVAAASILARAAFLKGLKRLGEEVGVELPKGASKQIIVVGKRLVEQKGPDILQAVAKMHFRTSDEILS